MLSARGFEKHLFRQLESTTERALGAVPSAAELARNFDACLAQVQRTTAADTWRRVVEVESTLKGQHWSLRVDGKQRTFSLRSHGAGSALAARIDRWLKRSSGEKSASLRTVFWQLWVESFLSALDNHYHHYSYADELPLRQAKGRGLSFVPGFWPKAGDGRLRVGELLDEALRERGMRAGSEVIAFDGQPVSQSSLPLLLRGWLRPEPFTYSLRWTSQGQVLDYRGKSIPYRHRTLHAAAKDGILYLRMTAFSAQSLIELRRLARRFPDEGNAGLIIDLRANGGGRLNVGLVDCFFKPGELIASYRDLRTAAEPIDLEATVEYYGQPLILLIDRYSASMSEVFAAAVKQQGRGLLIGERTFGKAVGQKIYPIGDEGELALAQDIFYYPGTRDSWNGEGIDPDLTIEVSDEMQAKISEVLRTPVIDLEAQLALDPVLRQGFRALEERQ